MPNVEYHSPWFMDTGRCQKTMPYETYQGLSDHAKSVCRFIVCEPGELPPAVSTPVPSATT